MVTIVQPDTLTETRFANATDRATDSATRRCAPSSASTKRDALAGVSLGDPQLDAQIHLARRVISRNIPILLQGETGSGKDVFANALHAASPACDGAFVAVNCASLPETLIESELFGYRAGAFTGAHRDGRRGKIAQAHGGTLFLDEIGDMPLTLQARLLRVLEEKRVAPLGADSTIDVEFQLISASHRNLEELVQGGQFREDLYYRLSGIALRLPPLRERADRRALIDRILIEEGHWHRPELAPDAEQALMQHPWPGNLRQMRHVLRTALALCDGPRLTAHHLPLDIVRGTAMPAPHLLPALGGGGQPAHAPAPALTATQTSERRTILNLLETHRWNVSTVARTLGVSRNTLYRRMHLLAIGPR